MSLRRKACANGALPKLWDGAPFRILAIDPGGTTGWKYAEWQPDTDIYVPDHLAEDGPVDVSTKLEFKFDGGQIGPEEHHLELWDLLRDYAPPTQPPLTVVCESFEFRQHINQGQSKTGVNLISKEYIGLVKLAQKFLNIAETHFQSASMAKSLVPDKGPQAHQKLKALGLYETNNPHQNDATRHLLRYLVVTLKVREPITNVWIDSLSTE